MTFELDTPHGWMMATMLAGIAQFERVLLDVEGGPDTWVAWSEWLSGFGVNASRAPSRLNFSSLLWSVQLARDGKGIALGWKYLMDDLLKEGSLVRPIPDAVTTGRNYYILSRPHGEANAQAETIIRLLLKEARQVK